MGLSAAWMIFTPIFLLKTSFFFRLLLFCWRSMVFLYDILGFYTSSSYFLYIERYLHISIYDETFVRHWTGFLEVPISNRIANLLYYLGMSPIKIDCLRKATPFLVFLHFNSVYIYFWLREWVISEENYQMKQDMIES